MLELLEARHLPNNLLSAWQSPFPNADLPPALAAPVEEPRLLLNPTPHAVPTSPPISFNPAVQIVAPNPTGIDAPTKQPPPAPSGIDDPLARMLTFWDVSPQPPAAHSLAGVPPITGGSKAAPATSAVPTPPPAAVHPTARAPSATADSSGSSAMLAPIRRSASPSAPVITGGSGTPFQAIEAGLASFYPLSPAGINPILRGVESVGLANVVTTFFQDADPNGAVADFSASINWGDGTATTTGTVSAAPGGGFSVTGSHTFSEEGTFTVATTVADLQAKISTSGAATAVVADPSITPSPVDFQAPAGTTANVTLATFTDADPQAAAADYQASIAWGDGMTSSGSVSADPQGGFDVTGSHNYMQPGRYAATATISEGMPGYGGRSQTVSASAVISDPAFTAGTVGVTTAAEGGASRLTATFTDGAQPAAASAFTATIAWGDGDSQGAAVVQNGSTFQIAADHTYLVAGAYTPTVTIADPEGDVVTESGTAAISDAPLYATGATAYAGAHSSANLSVATFTDADPNAGPSSFAATIAWGDGATSAGVIAESSGVFTVSGSHTYAMTGTFTPTTTIQDKTSTATATGSVIVSTVTATPQTVSASKGVSSVLTLATFTDSATGADTARIDWGDGTTPTTGVVAGASGNYTVTGSHSYAAVGSYTAKVTITTAAGQTSIVAVPVAVTDGPLSASGTSFSAAQGVDTGSVVVATFTAADANATPSDFAATVDWGDSSSTSGFGGPPSSQPGVSLFAPITQSGATFSVMGDYTYLNQGTFSVTVTITDGGGATATATSTATVGAGPINPTPVPINTTEGVAANNVAVATFTGDANAATIDWGDGTATTTGTVGNGTVAGNHTYSEVGTYTVKTTLTDAGGYGIPVSSTATVADAKLTAGAFSSPSLTEGQAFSGTLATFTDANPSAAAGDFAASIDWGNGDRSAATITQSFNGAFKVSGGTSYYRAGSFPVAVTVTDKDGASVALSGAAAVSDAALSGPADNLNATAGDLLNGAVAATFSDAFNGGSVSDYTATINWGDGTPSTAGVVEGSDGNYAVVGSHTYITPGTYTTQVQVSDPGGSATFTGSANVQPPPTYGLANFSSDGSGFTAMVDWADGTPQTPGIISGGPSEYHVSGQHSYAEEGSYSPIIYLYYQGVVVATLGTGATVIDGPMQAANTPQAAAPDPSIQVEDVGFLTKEIVTSDDGKPYNNPVWERNFGDAIQDPLVYVDGTSLKVGSLDFYADRPLPPSPDGTYLVRGFVSGLGINPATVIIAHLHYDGKRLVLLIQDAPVVADLPFDEVTQADMKISWDVRLPNGPTIKAGTTTNRLYVPLDYQYVPQGTTPRPLYETVLKTGCIRSGLTPDTEQIVLDNLWKEFESLKIVAAKNDPNAKDVVLTYWNDWEKAQLCQTTARLLKYHDGNCVGWTQFFLDVLEAQGIAGGTFNQLKSNAKYPPEGLLVANWNVGPNGVNNTDPRSNRIYPYVNILNRVGNKVGPLNVQNGGKWDYNWDPTNSSIFFDTTNYIKAQGESVRAQPPLAMFVDHVVAEIAIGGQTTLFDPSYGRSYQLMGPLAVHDVVKPMDPAVPYYIINDPYPGGQGRYLIRRNPGGILEIRTQYDSKARLELSNTYEKKNPLP